MEPYAVLLRGRAERDLARLPADERRRVAEHARALAHDPRPAGVRKISGRGDDDFRIRVGDYRVLYTIDDSRRVVTIGRILHRREAYRNR